MTVGTAAVPQVQPTAPSERRHVELDGWRALSILSVLACHLLPIGPARFELNALFGAYGMSLFFTLSGFLITSTLWHSPSIRSFLIRRLCRIMPVAYLYVTACLLILGSDYQTWSAHLGFTANYTTLLVPGWTSHFWSLCVEMHFYIGVAMLVLVAGRRALWLLPVGCLAVTGLRVYYGVHISINTHLRVDEILAGATLALVYLGYLSPLRRGLVAVPWYAWLLVALICCHPASGALNYLRPYACAALIGCTLWQRSVITPLLASRPARYIADVSYALYLFHGFGRVGWFAEGGTASRYLIKRPVGIAMTFVLAHFSTFYFEKWWINKGKQWSGRHSPEKPPVAVVP